MITKSRNEREGKYKGHFDGVAYRGKFYRVIGLPYPVPSTDLAEFEAVARGWLANQ